MTKTLPIPAGWQSLVDEMKQRAEREFRGLVFTDISANAGGWLSVEIDKHSVSVDQHWRALKLAEGYSTISWSVCSECGSRRAETKPGHVFPICDDCRERIHSNQ
jgi:hypothetical protein